MPIAPLFPLATRAAALPTQEWSEQAPLPYDPMTGIVPLRPRRRTRQPNVEMTPEDERSIWQHLMGAVQYAGETLDKPGAAARGVLSGLAGGQGPQVGIEALKNLIPFSDTMGLTDPRERVTGRELLEDVGALEENTPGLDVGDVAGFGAEVLTDPLLWMTGPLGTLGKGAKAAAAARAARVGGKADDLATAVGRVTDAISSGAKALPTGPMPTVPLTAAEQMRQGEWFLFGLRAPTIKPTTFGLPIPHPGITREAVVGTNLGLSPERAAQLTEAIYYGGGGPLSKYLSAPVRAVRGVMSPVVGGSFTGAMHRAKDAEFAERTLIGAALADAMPVLANRTRDLLGQYGEIANHFNAKGATQAFDEFAQEAFRLRDTMTTGDDVLDLMHKTMGLKPTDDLTKAVGYDNALADKTFEWLDSMNVIKNQAWDRYKALGGKGEDLTDLYGLHFPRRPSNFSILNKPGQEPHSGFTEYALARAGVLRDFPGGTKGINDLVRDRGLWGLKDDLTKMTGDEHEAWLRQGLKQAGVTVAPDASRAQLQRAYLSKRLEDMIDSNWADPTEIRQYRAPGEAKTKDWTKDDELERWFESFDRSAAQATPGEGLGQMEKVREYFQNLPDAVKEKGLFDRSVFEDWFDYMESVIDATGTLRSAHHFLTMPGAVQASGAPGTDEWGRLTQAWTNAGFKKRGLDTFLAEHPELGKNLDDLVVDPKIARGLRAFEELTDPKTVDPILKSWDKINSYYKGWMTTPWPSFNTRNLYSGFYQSASDGYVGVGDLGFGYKDAAAYSVGRASPKVNADVQILIDAGVLKEKGWMHDIAGEAVEAGSSFKPGFLKGFLSRRKPGSWKKRRLQEGWTEADISENTGILGRLFGMRGARGVPEHLAKKGITSIPAGAIGETGEEMYHTVEFLNRAGYGLALLKKGFKPSEIRHLVERSQFNYANASKYDKAIKRLVPFYSWTKRSIPYTLQKIFERPGGMTSQTIRAASDIGEQDSYTPSWLRQRMAIALPGGTPAATHFLTQSGLPIEDLNKLITEEGGLSGRTAERLLADFHPLAQVPYKVMSGREPFSGRKLKDLEPLTGSPTLDFALNVSPFGRAIGEGKRVADLEAIGGRKPFGMWLANNLTGAKVTTQDVDKWKLIDLENAIRRRVERSPYSRSYERVYIPKKIQQEGLGLEEAAEVKRMDKISRLIRKLQEQRAMEEPARG